MHRRNCCPFISTAMTDFACSLLVLNSSSACASFQTQRSRRRLRARRADARFDRTRSQASSVYGLPAPVRPRCAKQMAPNQRQCPHNCRRCRPLEERSAHRALTFASQRIDRDHRRSFHCYSAPSRSASLAKVISTAVARGFGYVEPVPASKSE